MLCVGAETGTSALRPPLPPAKLSRIGQQHGTPFAAGTPAGYNTPLNDCGGDLGVPGGAFGVNGLLPSGSLASNASGALQGAPSVEGKALFPLSAAASFSRPGAENGLVLGSGAPHNTPGNAYGGGNATPGLELDLSTPGSFTDGTPSATLAGLENEGVKVWEGGGTGGSDVVMRHTHVLDLNRQHQPQQHRQGAGESAHARGRRGVDSGVHAADLSGKDDMAVDDGDDGDAGGDGTADGDWQVQQQQHGRHADRTGQQHGMGAQHDADADVNDNDNDSDDNGGRDGDGSVADRAEEANEHRRLYDGNQGGHDYGDDDGDDGGEDGDGDEQFEDAFDDDANDQQGSKPNDIADGDED